MTDAPGPAACTVGGMHTHFASATHLASTFIGVLLVGTLWRLVAMHGLLSKSRTVQGIGKAMLTQY